ncbi:hypothetical protein [Sphingobium sp.]|uniref:hypothetical protein n=1 Tax=Sphingobium sp. TaxID=1912891 RepID=UPI00261F4CE7|nr:hypothetical protein [Sphingobium sp.]
MGIRPILPTLLIFAIIVLGGFGILRMALIRHDLVGLLSILASLILFEVFRRLLLAKNPKIRKFAQAPKRPIQLSTHASDAFQIYPGKPEGYAGYTDYTAMSVDVNDDLMARPPLEQYALLGSGNGFLHGIESRLAEGTQTPCNAFRLPNASAWERQFIGWLSYLQKSGTDNAGPSTENLRSVIRSTAATVCENGPVTMGFWDKVHNKKTENVDASCTSPQFLNELIDEYRKRFTEGEHAARTAISLSL